MIHTVATRAGAKNVDVYNVVRITVPAVSFTGTTTGTGAAPSRESKK